MLFAVLAVTFLSGRIVDRTTGQPLPGVRVTLADASATTGGDGRYRLRGLVPGTFTLTLQSNDVPVERLRVKLAPGANERDVRACSTTLDYGCGAARTTDGAG